tara:strand:+ start:1842 stop:3242 length:1401 start_codon:yes stop_codon:yes gene_type:complete
MTFDLIIVGAGMAGLPCAICAAQRELNVLLIEATNEIGGKLHQSTGQMAAACSNIQSRKGIKDSKEAHLKEAWKICKGTADLKLLRLAIDNAGETINWLENIGVKFPESNPVITYQHDIYSTKRYHWPTEKGQGILDAFKPLLKKYILKNKITLFKNTKLTKVLYKNDKVIGINAVTSKSKEMPFYGENVVLTAGGYTNNQKLFNKFTPNVPLYLPKMPNSSGSALEVAISANCKISGGDLYTGMIGGILENPDKNNSVIIALNTIPQDRPPWEIWVNTDGNRFTREDHPSADFRRHAVNKQKELKFYIIFDEGILANAPPIGITSDEGLSSHINGNITFVKSNSIFSLATKIGINPDNLFKTVNEYNNGVAAGRDQFSREHLPRKITDPPFYSLLSVAFALPSPAGIEVDENLRAIDTNGIPIHNLYAAGEIIGNTRIMGNCYIPGMGVGPTITFGKLLGENINK